MIVDSSSLIAVLNREHDADLHLAAMSNADHVVMAAPTRVETAIVASRIGLRGVEGLLEMAGIEVVEFTAEHATVARAAHVRYGSGSGSAARLNFGDCMSYALAKVRDEPLLFKGNDFTHTDVRPAITS
jgi:ribonuclease VapC